MHPTNIPAEAMADLRSLGWTCSEPESFDLGRPNGTARATKSGELIEMSSPVRSEAWIRVWNQALMVEDEASGDGDIRETRYSERPDNGE